jgi:hypothetical protein
LLVEIVLFGASAAALAAVGHVVLAVAFAAVAIGVAILVRMVSPAPNPRCPIYSGDYPRPRSSAPRYSRTAALHPTDSTAADRSFRGQFTVTNEGLVDVVLALRYLETGLEDRRATLPLDDIEKATGSCSGGSTSARRAPVVAAGLPVGRSCCDVTMRCV